MVESYFFEDRDFLYKKLQKYYFLTRIDKYLFTAVLRALIIKIKGIKITTKVAKSIAEDVDGDVNYKNILYEIARFLYENKDKSWFKKLEKKYQKD